MLEYNFSSKYTLHTVYAMCRISVQAIIYCVNLNVLH